MGPSCALLGAGHGRPARRLGGPPAARLCGEEVEHGIPFRQPPDRAAESHHHPGAAGGCPRPECQRRFSMIAWDRQKPGAATLRAGGRGAMGSAGKRDRERMTLALLTAARGISSLGDGLHYIAMAWLVMSSTGLALSASALVVARALPGAIFTLFAGGAADFGGLDAALSAGTAAGGFLPGVLASRVSSWNVLWLTLGLMAVGPCALAGSPWLAAAMAANFIFGVGTSANRVTFTTLFQLYAPPEMRGRVYSTSVYLGRLVLPFWVLAAGAIADHLRGTRHACAHGRVQPRGDGVGGGAEAGLRWRPAPTRGERPRGASRRDPVSQGVTTGGDSGSGSYRHSRSGTCRCSLIHTIARKRWRRCSCRERRRRTHRCGFRAGRTARVRYLAVIFKGGRLSRPGARRPSQAPATTRAGSAAQRASRCGCAPGPAQPSPNERLPLAWS